MLSINPLTPNGPSARAKKIYESKHFSHLNFNFFTKLSGSRVNINASNRDELNINGKRTDAAMTEYS